MSRGTVTLGHPYRVPGELGFILLLSPRGRIFTKGEKARTIESIRRGAKKVTLNYTRRPEQHLQVPS